MRNLLGHSVVEQFDFIWRRAAGQFLEKVQAKQAWQCFEREHEDQWGVMAYHVFKCIHGVFECYKRRLSQQYLSVTYG